MLPAIKDNSSGGFSIQAARTEYGFTSNSSGIVCSNTGMTDAIRTTILNFHNDARRRVAKGVEPNKSGTLNPAKNMRKKTVQEWDCTMEDQAQSAMNQCSGSISSWSNMAQNVMSGFYTNAKMWETGTACSANSDCTTYANSVCDNGLCVKGAPVPDTNNACSSNTGSTDAVRSAFLTAHNKYRSSVARGLEPDALGGNAPKASKMLKMVWDCSVEASAMAHAQKCVYEHSASSTRPGLGENIYMTSTVNFDMVKAANQASSLWWSELAQYGVGPSNNLTTALWNRPNTQIGHYSQMAWETSYRLGCAIAHCPSFTFGVCQYGPAGNYMNRLIYTIGNPCTSDAGCPGSYTCSVSEGLCNVV
ncbi:unnamed protein product [Nippostrongylus brasiliensis]|uniref:SCP domain-containing protein n=1 Tax=Nippostrongylus brasiliensis TaxID=27835 RepID=A0A158R1K5_NIPBR|nr:unnamed protein product [Nippostrongylus brasiliensis]